MNFRIADTFTASLARLTADEQKAVKTTAFDLQMNPASPGMQFHKLDRAKDKNFWSVRVNRDVRLIVHRDERSLMLCYVDHHDQAYQWAERRKIERHPKTGAAQLVEIRETVRKIEIPDYVTTEPPAQQKPALFTDYEDETLLGYGVPAEWLADVKAADEDGLLELAEHLPAEAGEALLALATGGQPAPAVQTTEDEDPFAHPDAQRRFRVMADSDELEQALAFPWEKWTIFLHPTQREMVTRRFAGPARVMGSAGTGKSVVAVHRAAQLAAAYPDKRVLLTTFSPNLARHLRHRLEQLVGERPANPVTVRAIDDVGIELYKELHGRPDIPTPAKLRTLLKAAASESDESKFSTRFLEAEWAEVVDAWQLDSWEAYRDVQRLGRKLRLGEKQRSVAWAIFDRVRRELHERGLVTLPGVFAVVTEDVRARRVQLADFVVVDEAQDITVPQLRFLAALAGSTEDGLFFAADLGQRIFQTPFSWKSLGVDVRGRSQTLRINYRTSHQIRRAADRLLPPDSADVDGEKQERRGTVSAFNGPEPVVVTCDDAEQECATVAGWIKDRLRDGVAPHEIAVIVRSDAQLGRARGIASKAGQKSATLTSGEDPTEGAVSLLTMHAAKGLEFRAVAVTACDDDVIPLQERIEAAADETELAEIYNTERHLLYVACTRARDALLVSGVEPGSEFLDDIR